MTLSSNHFKLTLRSNALVHLYTIDFGEKIDSKELWKKKAVIRSIRGELEKILGKFLFSGNNIFSPAHEGYLIFFKS